MSSRYTLSHLEKQAVLVHRLVIAQPAGRVEVNGALEDHPLGAEVSLAGVSIARLQVGVLDEFARFFMIGFRDIHLQFIKQRKPKCLRNQCLMYQ